MCFDANENPPPAFLRLLAAAFGVLPPRISQHCAPIFPVPAGNTTVPAATTLDRVDGYAEIVNPQNRKRRSSTVFKSSNFCANAADFF